MLFGFVLGRGTTHVSVVSARVAWQGTLLFLDNGFNNGVADNRGSKGVDNVVVFEGVIALNKDFGAGYYYKVILEEGVVVK